MRAAPVEDEVDRAAYVWAEQWVAAYANGEGGQVGALSCTLAAGARGPRTEHWPEVFRREGLAVARALKALDPGERLFVFRHYVERWYERDPTRLRWRRRRRPLPQRALAAKMGLPHGRYLRRRDRLKRRLQQWLWPELKKACAAASKSVGFGQVVEVSP